MNNTTFILGLCTVIVRSWRELLKYEIAWNSKRNSSRINVYMILFHYFYDINWPLQLRLCILQPCIFPEIATIHSGKLYTYIRFKNRNPFTNTYLLHAFQNIGYFSPLLYFDFYRSCQLKATNKYTIMCFPLFLTKANIFVSYLERLRKTYLVFVPSSLVKLITSVAREYRVYVGRISTLLECIRGEYNRCKQVSLLGGRAG